MSLKNLQSKLGKKKASGFVKEKIRRGTQNNPKRVARARKEPAPSYVARVVKRAASIAELLTEDDQMENLRVIREAKHATHLAFNVETKKMEERPDMKARMAGVVLDLAYREGTPIARSISVSGKVEDLGTRLAALQSSPTAAKMLESLKAGAIDVQATVQQKGPESASNSPSEDSPNYGRSQNEQ